jgi:hypothetical protein
MIWFASIILSIKLLLGSEVETDKYSEFNCQKKQLIPLLLLLTFGYQCSRKNVDNKINYKNDLDMGRFFLNRMKNLWIILGFDYK